MTWVLISDVVFVRMQPQSSLMDLIDTVLESPANPVADPWGAGAGAAAAAAGSVSDPWQSYGKPADASKTF